MENWKLFPFDGTSPEFGLFLSIAAQKHTEGHLDDSIIIFMVMNRIFPRVFGMIML
jgi:hypothetical protein